MHRILWIACISSLHVRERYLQRSHHRQEFARRRGEPTPVERVEGLLFPPQHKAETLLLRNYRIQSDRLPERPTGREFPFLSQDIKFCALPWSSAYPQETLNFGAIKSDNDFIINQNDWRCAFARLFDQFGQRFRILINNATRKEHFVM